MYAPDVLASFGTGSAQVAIRVVAPDGAAAYTASLRADQAARVWAGKQLLRNPRIHVANTALPALANGQVDARLLTVFAALATLHSVRVLGFAAPPAAPARDCRCAPPTSRRTARAPRSGRTACGRWPASCTRSWPPYRPASVTEFRLPGGSPALRVEFAAPEPARAARKELTRIRTANRRFISHWSSGPEWGVHDDRKFTVIRLSRRVALLAGSVLLTAAALAGPASVAAAAPASSGYGWVRLAHLSPNTPAVDVYLYSYGMPNAKIVLHHVSYGTVSPYEKVAHGEYTVAMRAAGAVAVHQAGAVQQPDGASRARLHGGRDGPGEGAAAPGAGRPAGHAPGQVAGPGDPGVAQGAPGDGPGRPPPAGP